MILTLAAIPFFKSRVELNDLQTRLDRMDYEDEYDTPPGPEKHLHRQYLNDWPGLIAAENGHEKRQMDKSKLIGKIPQIMRTYVSRNSGYQQIHANPNEGEAMLQQAAITKLDIPTCNIHGAIMKKINEGTEVSNIILQDRLYLENWATSLYAHVKETSHCPFSSS